MEVRVEMRVWGDWEHVVRLWRDKGGMEVMGGHGGTREVEDMGGCETEISERKARTVQTLEV